MKNDKAAELPIRSRRSYEAGGRVDEAETVYCPNRAQSLEVEDCLRCRHCLGRTFHGDPSVVCLHPAARRPDRPVRPVRLPSPAELTPLSEIMTRQVTCVATALNVDSLGTLLLEQNISACPVVDDEGRPVGVASKTDLVRWYHDGEPGSTVEDLMMPMAFTLTEDAPIAYAATLMAVEDVHHLPIVAGDGRVVGIVSALDIVRWLAHLDGYVVPGGSR
jgi:CBS domain-containing protein